MPEIPDKEIYEMDQILMNGSVGFLCNLRNVVQRTLVDPQASRLVVVNLVILDVNLHAGEDGVVLRTGEQSVGREDRASDWLWADAAGALSVRAAVVTVAPLLVVGVVGEHGLDVQPLHPVSQRPGGNVVLHAGSVYGLSIHDLFESCLEAIFTVLLVSPHGSRIQQSCF